MGKPLKIFYLFTTFPVATETFLQREIQAMAELPLKLEFYSLWGGKKAFKNFTVLRFAKWKLLFLLFLLPYWLGRNPTAFRYIFRALRTRKLPSLRNAGETFIGLSFGIVYAGKFSRNPPALFHASWATMPATAALLLSKLTNIPFSMGAHAFDIYKDGGDWLLREKLKEARFVHTTTDAAFRYLVEMGALEKNVAVIRRGLNFYPKIESPHNLRHPLRLLNVGRLVEKKDHLRQLAIYAELMRRGIPFRARIIGAGPMEKSIQLKIAELNLTSHVKLLGFLDNEAVFEQFSWADIFLYTTKIDSYGNRDGTPNVILEAMATGVPVIAATHPGISEVITGGENGFIIDLPENAPWIQAITDLMENRDLYEKIRISGQSWVKKNTDARKNAATLYQRFQDAVTL